MTVAITSQVLYDGIRNLVMQVQGVSDGTNDTVVLVDISELNPVPQSVKVLCVTYDVPFGIVRLAYEGDEPVQIADCCGWNELDFKKIGGAVNTIGAPADNNSNGDILATTMGFEAGCTFNIKLEMVKKYP